MPLDVKRQDSPELLEQEADVVPSALLAESAEVAQVLPDLGGRREETFAQLLRAHDLRPLGKQGSEHPDVQRQSNNHDLGDRRPGLIDDARRDSRALQEVAGSKRLSGFVPKAGGIRVGCPTGLTKRPRLPVTKRQS